MTNRTKDGMHRATAQTRRFCAVLSLLTVLLVTGATVPAAGAEPGPAKFGAAVTATQPLAIALQLAGLPRTMTLCRDPALIATKGGGYSEYRWAISIGDRLLVQITSQDQDTNCTPHEVATEAALAAKAYDWDWGSGQELVGALQFELDFTNAAMLMRLDQSQPLVTAVSPSTQIRASTRVESALNFWVGDDIAVFSRGNGAVQVNDPLADIPDCTGSCFAAYPMLDLTRITVGSYAIGPGTTGNWFDPEQSGQGFVVEVLPDNVMLVEWFVYAPLGGQAWIVGTGPIVGNSAVIQGYQKVGSGGVFPPAFDAAQLQDRFWGTITLTFADCNSGTANWEPVVSGYSAGSMPLQRLTLPAGLTCP